MLYGSLWNHQKNIGRLSCKKSCWLYRDIYGDAVRDSISVAEAVSLGSHCCSHGSNGLPWKNRGLEKGKISGSGTHKELLESHPLYEEMIKQQFVEKEGGA